MRLNLCDLDGDLGQIEGMSGLSLVLRQNEKQRKDLVLPQLRKADHGAP